MRAPGLPTRPPRSSARSGRGAVAPPDVVAPGDLSPDSPARDVVHAAIASSVLRLLAHDPGVRLGDDPEQVHQARVATRRLRSDLRTFRSLLVPEWDEALRDELQWLGAELGAVRDTEVLLDLLRSKVSRLGGRRPAASASSCCNGSCASGRTSASSCSHALRSDRYAALLDRLVEAAREPALLPDGGRARDRGPATARARPVEEAARDPSRRSPTTHPTRHLHAVRIRAKRSRYAAEAVTPALGQPARRFAKAVAGLQEVLGDHQDAVVAATWLRGRGRDRRQPRRGVRRRRARPA